MPSKRPRVSIVKMASFDGVKHCGNCCTNMTVYCDCALEKISLYVEYDHQRSKAYAYECLTCNAINKT